MRLIELEGPIPKVVGYGNLLRQRLEEGIDRMSPGLAPESLADSLYGLLGSLLG